MNKKISFFGLIFVVIVILAYFAYQRINKQPTVTFSGPERIEKDSQSLPEGVPDPKEFKTEEDIINYIQKEGGLKGLGKLMASGANKPLDFYAKVLDQYGEPIAGADITMIVLQSRPFQGSKARVTVRTKTDAEGGFVITGINGAVIETESIRKEGYFFNNSIQKDFYSSPTTSEVIVNKTTENDPWVYQGWKIEEVAKNIISGNSQSFVEPNNSYFIKLDGSTGRDYPEKNSYGDLKITVNREQLEDRFDPISWSVTIEMLDGGLIKHEDSYTYIAPDTEYERTYSESSQKSNSENWKSEFNKNFYLKTDSLYGKARIQIRPFHSKLTSVRIYYDINPDGSRNLFSSAIN